MNVFELPMPANEYVYRYAILGREAFSENRLEDAELFDRKALGHARKRLKTCPQDLLAVRDVAICWDRLRYLLQRIGEVEEAKDACLEADRRYSQVVELAGRYGDFGRELARFRWGAAALHLQDQNYADAKTLLESSVEILWVRSLAEPTCRERLRELAEAMVRLGIAIVGQCELELRHGQ
ncbi:hypothetical protein [Caulobacter sp. RHG1]|uniref:hypothetical protein n=1 Tax=Caulobacter sp. (strain RHG1) TaxID=2545762 RepID=UPI001552CC85|nr:hypothetical protein [Caulobacter sp. RHG1]